MILRIGGSVLNIPVMTLLVLVVSATFLLTGLVISDMSEYKEQTLGFVIPGAILGVIGVVVLFKQLHDAI